MLELLHTAFTEISHYFADSSLGSLFVLGFLSATLLPGGSEAALLTVLSQRQFAVTEVIVVATLSNTLGGLTNYGLGLWLPNRTQKEKHGHKALAWLKNHGYWALLLSWLPVIGDPLCLAAGWLRMKFLPSFLMIMVGKAIRYAMLAALFYGIF